jgi:hypothetical protein
VERPVDVGHICANSFTFPQDELQSIRQFADKEARKYLIHKEFSAWHAIRTTSSRQPLGVTASITVAANPVAKKPERNRYG